MKTRKLFALGLSLGLAQVTGCAQLVGLDSFVDGAGASTSGGGGQGAGTSGGGGQGAGTSGGGGQGAGGGGTCVPDAPCYAGPEGTAGVGVCAAGSSVCGDDGSFTCEGEVLPQALSAAVCAAADDLDCNGYACAEPRWVRYVGNFATADASSQGLVDMAVASDGSAYVVGGFGGTIETEAGPLSASSSYDGLVQKYSPDGVLEWTLAIPDAEVRAITLTESGDLVIVGQTDAAATDVGGIALPPASGYDAFVARLSPSGVAAWATLVGGGGGEFPHALAVAGDRVVVAGESGSSTIGAHGCSPTAASQAMLAELEAADGALTRVTCLTGQSAEARGVAIEPSGAVLVAGVFQGFLSIGLVGSEPRTVFVARLTLGEQTQVAWATDLEAPDAVDVGGLVVSGSTVHVFGGSEGPLSFPTGEELTAGGFVWNLSTQGMSLSATLISSDLIATVRGLSVDAQGYQTLVGFMYSGTTTVGGFPLACAAFNYPCSFVGKLDASGAGVWAEKAGDATSAEAVLATAEGVWLAGTTAVAPLVFDGAGYVADKGNDGFVGLLAP
jgi:hypothetical protein